jgi:hypothetical protein
MKVGPGDDGTNLPVLDGKWEDSAAETSLVGRLGRCPGMKEKEKALTTMRSESEDGIEHARHKMSAEGVLTRKSGVGAAETGESVARGRTREREGWDSQRG